ncbi:MAG: helix-turn-helix domain-containing protein [Deltaproteobacteria bacterium]|jgi:putative zinc finger/helix-turn-helix YgiT family protein|nr:helix-turn-helix domain-containing protein [Deltaproteobacteria bacterium]
MKIRCPKCGNFIQSKIEKYKYKESGLDNVFLKNIPVYKCSCGISFASIFRASRLNELIAQTLLEKPALLGCKEIRFLRKNMHMPSKDFAKRLGVEKTTISKWENGLQKHREAYDRSIRFLYMINKKIEGEEKNNIFRILEKKKLKEQDTGFVITAEKKGKDYVVNFKPIIGSLGPELPTVWISQKKIFFSIAGYPNFALELLQTESHQMFSSQELLSTETISNSMVLTQRRGQ